ncbi:phosphatidylserine decarboxylase [Pradoshia eiseniae]|uniref:Phosphatidylserine decarboxylase proenzyme n=1 Tax=Pradoshia eiseniae TaxID=2064768 RepID=A0A2S7N386_9BACI|nr:phosphatidylserine decarboxylase [Pradoshia eiseniae]PQD96430.1 phosphatidylserine decarboxylase [Pradoshia eiseniae]
MKEKLYQSLIELTNGRWSSSLLRRFALSPASKRIVPSFAKQYKINVEEMDKPLEAYESLHDFFTRNLKSGARRFDGEIDMIASPVDAVLEDMGSIQEDATFQVKGKVYSIEEMLGGKKEAERYLGGQYMVLYLSPSHYHRIHSPVDGTVIRKQTLGSKSYPVNRWGMTLGKSPLSKNYREITEIEYEGGRLALIKVGAMFVNTIERTHTGDTLHKGEEIGYFSFGSTVVLLFEKGRFAAAQVKTPVPVWAGEILGTYR